MPVDRRVRPTASGRRLLPRARVSEHTQQTVLHQAPVPPTGRLTTKSLHAALSVRTWPRRPARLRRAVSAQCRCGWRVPHTERRVQIGRRALPDDVHCHQLVLLEAVEQRVAELAVQLAPLVLVDQVHLLERLADGDQ